MIALKPLNGYLSFKNLKVYTILRKSFNAKIFLELSIKYFFQTNHKNNHEICMNYYA